MCMSGCLSFLIKPDMPPHSELSVHLLKLSGNDVRKRHDLPSAGTLFDICQIRYMSTGTEQQAVLFD